MFPLDFPYEVLSSSAGSGEWVLDPFCGRGTTNYASRLLNLPTIGIDSSPVAVAISEAKLARTSPDEVIEAARQILDTVTNPPDLPQGEFWEWAYHPDVLNILCRLRDGLLADCHSDARIALRAIILGALHGPRAKFTPSYFSNQSVRTYAPKPGYAVKFWKKRQLSPEKVDVLQIIRTRAERYYDSNNDKVAGFITQGDSRDKAVFEGIAQSVKWIITSPPYYGMRTYIPDQWLRMWFLGGQPVVDYSNDGQLAHPSPVNFAQQLNLVWQNINQVSAEDARMIVRFGGINDRKADPLQIMRLSLENSGWKILKVESAGFASAGYRQAKHIRQAIRTPREEYDVWATKVV